MSSPTVAAEALVTRERESSVERRRMLFFVPFIAALGLFFAHRGVGIALLWCLLLLVAIQVPTAVLLVTWYHRAIVRLAARQVSGEASFRAVLEHAEDRYFSAASISLMLHDTPNLLSFFAVVLGLFFLLHRPEHDLASLAAIILSAAINRVVVFVTDTILWTRRGRQSLFPGACINYDDVMREAGYRWSRLRGWVEVNDSDSGERVEC